MQRVAGSLDQFVDVDAVRFDVRVDDHDGPHDLLAASQHEVLSVAPVADGSAAPTLSITAPPW